MIKAQPVEFWMPVKDFPNYEVSDKGRVHTLNYNKTGQIKVMKEGDQRGYASVELFNPSLSTPKKSKRITVHKLVSERFIGPRPEGRDVNHRNGNKRDNRSENLEYLTKSQNSKWNFVIGLQSNQGINHSQAKLDEGKVLDIRRRAAAGELAKDIHTEYGVTESCVQQVIQRVRWTHI